MEEYLGERYWGNSVVSNIYKSNVLASLTHCSNNDKSGRCLLYKESDLYQTTPFKASKGHQEQAKSQVPE